MKNFNKIEFVKSNTITDRDAIIKANCLPKSFPKSIKLNAIEPIGHSTFKGDSLPECWSCNDQFKIDVRYPIYENMDCDDCFVIGKDGGGMKIIPNAWKKIKYFN